MNYYVIENTGKWADKQLLGLLPTVRAIFQAKAAGATEVTILSNDPDKKVPPKGSPQDVSVKYAALPSGSTNLTDLANRLAADTNGPVFIADSNIIFQRDFVIKAISAESNTLFKAKSEPVAVIRQNEGAYVDKDCEGQASEIETPAGLKAAKKMLYKGLKKPLLVNGLLATFIQRPIAHIFTVAIVNTSIRPNHVSIFAMLVGLSGAALLFFAGPNAWVMQLGLFLYFMGSVFDCIDGDLARLKHQGTYLGSWLDTIADDSSTTAILFALGYYVAQQTGNINWFLLGAGGGAAFLLSESYIYYHLLKIYHSGDVLDFVWASGVKKRASAESIVDYLMLFVKRDFFTVALFILGMFNKVHWGLVWLSVMMYFYFAYVLVDIILSARNPGWRYKKD